MPVLLKDAIDEVVTIINFIKCQSLSASLFYVNFYFWILLGLLKKMTKIEESSQIYYTLLLLSLPYDIVIIVIFITYYTIYSILLYII